MHSCEVSRRCRARRGRAWLRRWRCGLPRLRRRLLLRDDRGGGVTGASPAASSARKRRIGTPSLTRSPILIKTSSTVPAWVAGTSMVALSDSSETRGSSTLTLAPGWTWISMTGTSLKSPMSGTLMSLIASILAFLPMRVFPAASNRGGVRLLRIDAVAADRLGELVGWQCASSPAFPARRASPSAGPPRRSRGAGGDNRTGRSHRCPAPGSVAAQRGGSGRREERM